VFHYYGRNPAAKSSAKSSAHIASLFESARKALFPNKEESKNSRRNNAKQKRKADHELLDAALIRSNRQRKLVGQNIGGSEISFDRPPKHSTIEDMETFIDGENDRVRERMKDFQSSNQIVKPPTDSLTDATSTTPVETPEAIKLNFARSCHICGVNFKELDPFYDQLCQSCASFNHMKRSSSVDMTGRVCLLTGARVKIGYCVALKLLRMNATVIITTRFPHDAAERYSKEPDFLTFKGRLHIYGLDFRDITAVHYFCAHIRSKFTRLDALINNAAQTVRRPPQYYEHLIPNERTRVPDSVLDVISVTDVYKLENGSFDFTTQKTIAAGLTESMSTSTDLITKDLIPAPTSALLSQTKLIPSDSTSSHAFPPGLYDRDDQQVDIRTQNSWTMNLTEISTVEMIECHAINTFAPWVIISELTPLLRSTTSPPSSTAPSPSQFPRFIVNVSAMEGQFYRRKTSQHPHTNMAKAALNMLTRTSASGLMEEGIYMSAVDTGWITDEKPVGEWDKREAPPPLDEIDAAMRILDPVILGVSGVEMVWGVFMKNYMATRW